MLAVVLGTHYFHPPLCSSPHLLGGHRCPALSYLGAVCCLTLGPGWETGREKPQGDLLPLDLGLSLY